MPHLSIFYSCACPEKQEAAYIIVHCNFGVYHVKPGREK